jgi:hypothetical protein
MKRRAWLGLSLLALAACSGGGAHRDAPVSNAANICAIYSDNPHWEEAAREAEARWGVPQEIKMAIIWRESTFRGEARPPYRKVMGVPTGKRLSSAYGFSQAIDGTWDWYQKDHAGARAERNRFNDAIDFVGWYMNKTRDLNGVSLHDAFSQYLAYHEGHGGFRSGRWRHKPNVMRAAGDVARMAERYRRQLEACGARRA